MRIILASQSAARKHALDVLGLSYETIPSHFDESSLRDNNPYSRAQALSVVKAKTVAQQNADAVVIAADLFVVFNEIIYEKPKNIEEAIKMLKDLSGMTFDIVSGLAVYRGSDQLLHSTTEVCHVRFRKLTEYELNEYVSRFPVLTFSAAFDGDGLLRFAEYVEGNYNFRAGLPMDKLITFLRTFGVVV